MAQAKKTVVLGASGNPARYSYLALRKLAAHNHPVIAIGKKEGKVDGVAIQKDHVVEGGIDTVTLYLNPGTENEELIQKAKDNNIEPFIGCTLVMLSTGQY
jgi:predicted CoA-binding protein